MNIDFVKEFDFIKGRRLRSQGGVRYMLRCVRPDRGAPPETAYDYTYTIIIVDFL